MLLDNDAGTIGKVSKSDPTLKMILHEAEWGENIAMLHKAYLTDADGRASDIVRQFDDGTCAVDICNSHFGLIEKCDMCVIATWTDNDDNDHAALLIGHPVSDISDFEPTGIILEKE